MVSPKKRNGTVQQANDDGGVSELKQKIHKTKEQDADALADAEGEMALLSSPSLMLTPSPNL